MRSALLDHPWALDDALNPNSDAFGVLERFEDLRREHGIEAVRFVGTRELDRIWQRLDYANLHTRAYAILRMFGENYRKNDEESCTATPHPEPNGLRPAWKAALREAMADGADWRNPQIIIPPTRDAVWPRQRLVTIHFDACNDQAASGPYERVVARLDSYQDHPFAQSDFNPWDLRHTHPPDETDAAHVQHPCILPRPPTLTLALEDMRQGLAEERRQGWRRANRYFFIPEANWRAEQVGSGSWRQGRAFPYRRCRNSRDRNGYVDYLDIEWVWDNSERHWDVQTSPQHMRINHMGELIG